MISLSHPAGRLAGTVQLPASKSIANRLLLLRAVASQQAAVIHNLSDARDTVILSGILADLKSGSTIDVHDAGTVMRFLTAYLCTREGEWTLTGTARMQARPVGALVDVLCSLGADITYLKSEGFPPLRIRGKRLRGGRVEIDGSVSSQFISALLMVAPLFEQPLELVIRNQPVSVPYIRMTLELMAQWGAACNWQENVIRVHNTPYSLPAEDLFVESDWSAASYFYSMLALAAEGELRLPRLYAASLQGDSVCSTIFEKLGVATRYAVGEVILTKKTGSSSELSFDFINCPDIAQTVAVCCAARGVRAHLTGLQTLAIKETDRITALKKELERAGASVEATHDSLSIGAAALSLNGQAFETYGDHRMAMSFAPLALLGPMQLEDPGVVAKSFPRFWEELKKLGFQANEM
jgi:3-phosphoshikimate 1-carboxyvinyltransferase